MSNLHGVSMIVPNQHEKNEWSRMAQAAYASDRNDVGHRFSAAASLPTDFSMTVRHFDRLQTEYRAWLCRNEWPEEAAPTYSPEALAHFITAEE